ETTKNTVIVAPTWVKLSPKSRMSHGNSVGSTKWKKCEVPWQKPTSEMTVASRRKPGTGAAAVAIGRFYQLTPIKPRSERRPRVERMLRDFFKTAVVGPIASEPFALAGSCARCAAAGAPACGGFGPGCLAAPAPGNLTPVNRRDPRSPLD